MTNDEKLIRDLGGSTKVANLLGYSIQRVSNWMTRGIPSKVRLEHQDFFLNKKERNHS